MEKSFTQKDLAQKTNEKPSVIQDYESGKAIPNPQILGKFERILGVKLRGECLALVFFSFLIGARRCRYWEEVGRTEEVVGLSTLELGLALTHTYHCRLHIAHDVLFCRDRVLVFPVHNCHRNRFAFI